MAGIALSRLNKDPLKGRPCQKSFPFFGTTTKDARLLMCARVSVCVCVCVRVERRRLALLAKLLQQQHLGKSLLLCFSDDDESKNCKTSTCHQKLVMETTTTKSSIDTVV